MLKFPSRFREGNDTNKMQFPLWSVGPFILMLLSIAVVPLVFPKW
jgi:hypothetical protein